MKYFSTRNSNIKSSFEDIFFKGLASDGGLFLPENFPQLDEVTLKSFSKLNFQEMSYEIFKMYTDNTFENHDLKNIINTAYKSFRNSKIVDVKECGTISFVQLHHGPTLAFKDIAMQVLGEMYASLLSKNDKKINLITATSGDTGAAAIDAFQGKKNINIFVLHPHNKISDVQRKLMTTYDAKNVFNIAVEGSFDDCQKIVKDLFVDKNFSERINMSGVNSINWARIIAQIVYYFYIYFKFNPEQKPIDVSVPTGNFGDVYAGYISKKMGLNINSLIVSTNQNNILERCIQKGEYKPEKVTASISPSMDIQVASNFERILFDIVDNNSDRVNQLMDNLKNDGFFKLNDDELKKLQNNFKSSSCSEDETLAIIKEIYSSYNYIIDPHTATAAKPLLHNKNEKNKQFCFETAHPSKFPLAIEKSIKIKPSLPNGFEKIDSKKEIFDILDNSLEKVKAYVLERV